MSWSKEFSETSETSLRPVDESSDDDNNNSISYPIHQSLYFNRHHIRIINKYVEPNDWLEESNEINLELSKENNKNNAQLDNNDINTDSKKLQPKSKEQTIQKKKTISKKRKSTYNAKKIDDLKSEWFNQLEETWKQEFKTRNEKETNIKSSIKTTKKKTSSMDNKHIQLKNDKNNRKRMKSSWIKWDTKNKNDTNRKKVNNLIPSNYNNATQSRGFLDNPTIIGFTDEEDEFKQKELKRILKYYKTTSGSELTNFTSSSDNYPNNNNKNQTIIIHKPTPNLYKNRIYVNTNHNLWYKH